MNHVSKYFSAVFVAIALISAIGCAPTAQHEGTGQYVDDSVITAKVKAAVFDEPTLKSAEINVETFKGVVQLSGFVDSAQNVSKAESIAMGVAGVASVRNNLIVK